MNNKKIELTEGQIKISFNGDNNGKFTLNEAGFKKDIYKVEGGNLRIKLDLGYIQDTSFYKMPIIEFNYTENIRSSQWIVEFNGVNILETKDHSGKSTVLLLNRKKLDKLKQRHNNIIIIHGDFSEEVFIKNSSIIHIF